MRIERTQVNGRPLDDASSAGNGDESNGSSTGDDHHHPASPRKSGGLDSQVLVVNRGYSAIRVISARRAFLLLFRDHAEVIQVDAGQYLTFDFSSWLTEASLRWELERDQHDWVWTVRFPIAVPQIIRLLRYDRVPRPAVKLNRRNVFARDGHRCQYCGRHFPTSELSVDHVVPRSSGGGDHWTNLVCACIRCNARKGDRTPDQAGMELLREPAPPRHGPLLGPRPNVNRLAAWRPFLGESANGNGRHT